MERKAGASPSLWFPSGPEAEHSWLLLLLSTDWRWWWGCLDSGDNCWKGQEFSVKLTLDWGAEVWRARTAWWLAFGFHWSGLPQIKFDSVEMKLTHVTYDAVHFLCSSIALVTLLGVVCLLDFNSGQKGPIFVEMLGCLQLSYWTRHIHKSYRPEAPNGDMRMCVSWFRRREISNVSTRRRVEIISNVWNGIARGVQQSAWGPKAN